MTELKDVRSCKISNDTSQILQGIVSATGKIFFFKSAVRYYNFKAMCSNLCQILWDVLRIHLCE